MGVGGLMEAVGLGERQWRKEGGEGDEGAKISISDFHILKALIYLARPGALSNWREARGRGGRRSGRRTKGEGTYDIFTVESHFHCSCGQHVAQKPPHASVGHTGCLNAHRCHDTLFCTHAHDWILVGPRYFCPAICQCQQMIYCSRCVTPSPRSRM